ncbi:MAG: monovalent cation/H(+) antiporter subunit G [Lachnospiraceae bacterium]|nr:monovalent cation/H(+) antiporter subunit G [Lachnospiraceae bacterium]
MSTIQIVIADVFLTIGALLCLISTIGVFRMKFVMNRMHAAAIADTGGLFFIITGLVILCGFTFMTLKLLLLVVIFWITSPVSSHLLSNMVKSTMPEAIEKNAVQKTLEK